MCSFLVSFALALLNKLLNKQSMLVIWDVPTQRCYTRHSPNQWSIFPVKNQTNLGIVGVKSVKNPIIRSEFGDKCVGGNFSHQDYVVLKNSLKSTKEWVDKDKDNSKPMQWFQQNFPLPKVIMYRMDNRIPTHYSDVMMSAMASQIASLTIVYSTVYSSTYQRKHENTASLAYVRGIYRDRWIPRTKCH